MVGACLFSCHSTLRQTPSSSVRKPHITDLPMLHQDDNEANLGDKRAFPSLVGSRGHGETALNAAAGNLGCSYVLKL